jgi:hypothetical protein
MLTSLVIKPFSRKYASKHGFLLVKTGGPHQKTHGSPMQAISTLSSAGLFGSFPSFYGLLLFIYL